MSVLDTRTPWDGTKGWFASAGRRGRGRSVGEVDQARVVGVENDEGWVAHRLRRDPMDASSGIDVLDAYGPDLGPRAVLDVDLAGHDAGRHRLMARAQLHLIVLDLAAEAHAFELVVTEAAQRSGHLPANPAGRHYLDPLVDHDSGVRRYRLLVEVVLDDRFDARNELLGDLPVYGPEGPRFCEVAGQRSVVVVLTTRLTTKARPRQLVFVRPVNHQADRRACDGGSDRKADGHGDSWALLE